MSLLDPALSKTLQFDTQRLSETEIPIVTVSASTREDVKGFYGLPEDEEVQDIVFSRAHYSMALAVAIEAWGKEMRPEKAWIVDPTNYVSNRDWKRVVFTETIGKTIARRRVLKIAKDLIDRFGRKKLPILSSIEAPLLSLTKNTKKPILSMHIATGNLLAKQGKEVVQMVTDPHVRDEYLDSAERDNIRFLVFDERTRFDFLEKASVLHKKVDSKRVVISGPPVDPRIVAARKKKHAWRSGPLRVCITTGGLGTNKREIKILLEQLIPALRKREPNLQLMIYAGTHSDIFEMVKNKAKKERDIFKHLTGSKALKKYPKLSVIYHPQIVDANELLVTHAFPWAHGFISKPSGDMAYDTVASGSFLLTLSEWGEWEHNIRNIFEQKDIARRAETKHICEQLKVLCKTQGKAHSWVETAMNNAFEIDKLFLSGTKNILKEMEN